MNSVFEKHRETFISKFKEIIQKHSNPSDYGTGLNLQKGILEVKSLEDITFSKEEKCETDLDDRAIYEFDAKVRVTVSVDVADVLITTPLKESKIEFTGSFTNLVSFDLSVMLDNKGDIQNFQFGDLYVYRNSPF